MTDFVSIDRDFERHRGDNRPKIIQPGGGHAYYSRVTSFVDCLEDKFHLQLWDKRMVAIGLASRPDLLMSVQAHLDDKRQLNRICDDAKEAAKAGSAAVTGTALHKFTDLIDQGQELPAGLAAGARASLEKFREATANLKVIDIEKKLVQDFAKAAGTADRIYEYQGKRYIGDTKSGNVELGILKIAAQLAMYARSQAYDVATGARSRIDVELDRAIVMHMPAVEDPADARCEVIWVDIKVGWELVILARQVRQARARKFADLTRPLTDMSDFAVDDRTDRTLHQVLAGPPELTLEAQLRRCVNQAEALVLWEANQASWTDDLTAIAKSLPTAV